jgi:hypothetical protein
MKLKLDAKTVAGLALGKGRNEDFAWDSELEGFGLRLRRKRDGGVLRTWAAQYRANEQAGEVWSDIADDLEVRAPDPDAVEWPEPFDADESIPHRLRGSLTVCADSARASKTSAMSRRERGDRIRLGGGAIR